MLALCALAALGACQTSYEFAPLTLGAPQAQRAPRALDNGPYLRAVFADLAGRAPAINDYEVEDEAGATLYRFQIDEADFLEQVLADVGDPAPLRALIATGLAGAAGLPQKDRVADPGAFITEQFRRLLGRDPTPYELHAFVEEWRGDAAVGPTTVVRALVGSREYGSH